MENTESPENNATEVVDEEEITIQKKFKHNIWPIVKSWILYYITLTFALLAIFRCVSKKAFSPA